MDAMPARAWTVWPLRLLLTVQAGMAVAQPILIGQYLDGDFGQLAAHRLNGSVLPAITMLCIAAALAHWLLGRGRFWPVPVTVLLVPVEGMQLAAAYSRSLAVHIPLGTALVASLLFLAGWSWTPRIRRARPARPTAARTTTGGATSTGTASAGATTAAATRTTGPARPPIQPVPGRPS